MRDLRNRVAVGIARSGAARGDERRARPSRARQRRRARRRAYRTRRSPALDHRPYRRRPADYERGRHVRRRSERRDLQLPGAAPRARPRRPRVPHALRHRGDRPSLRGARPRLRAPPARHVRDRDLGRAQAPARARARPLRDQAALLPPRRRRTRVRVGAARIAARRDRSRRARGVPCVQLDPRAVLDLPRYPQAARRPSARLARGRQRRPSTATRAPRRSSVRTCARTTRQSCSRSLRARLRDSVRAHLLADVPVGVLLSGGVDSAALAAFAAEESGERVHTFTIGFEERSFDERADARRVAERYDTDHHELLVRPDPTLLLPALADAFDEPFADSSALPTYLVSELAASHVKVALSGEGGDELFGGYYTYAADLLAERFGTLARLARPAVERLPTSTSKASFDYKAKRFVRAAHLPPLERHHGWKEIFSADARTEITGRTRRVRPGGRVPRALPRDRRSRRARAPAGRRLRRLPRRRSAREDRPRVDGALARSARAVPRRGGDESRIRPARRDTRCVGCRRRCCCGRPSRRCCRTRWCTDASEASRFPAAAWLRGDLAPFARETLSAETLRRQGFFRPESVSRLIDEHVAGAEDRSRRLWGLLAFTLWYERHVESDPPQLHSARMDSLVA